MLLQAAFIRVKERQFKIRLVRGNFMSETNGRPLSPHITIWKWGPAMAVSIANRICGVGLATVGALVLLWWLGAIANGPSAYASFLECANAWYGRVVLIGLTWAFLLHMMGGIRHFILDIGAGYALSSNKMGSLIIFALSILGTAAIWAWIIYGKGA
jgi:succinate dehydrogenase / fumarate reductase, cytochrome b subunit